MRGVYKHPEELSGLAISLLMKASGLNSHITAPVPSTEVKLTMLQRRAEGRLDFPLFQTSWMHGVQLVIAMALLAKRAVPSDAREPPERGWKALEPVLVQLVLVELASETLRGTKQHRFQDGLRGQRSWRKA